MSRVLLFLMAMLLFANIIFLELKIEQSRETDFQREEPFLIFPKPSVVRALSLGHINFIADYYWLKTIQYLGLKVLQGQKPFQIYKYAEFVTDLAPRFMEAYYYPSVIMIIYQITPEENLKLLEKGVHYLPESKDLAFLLGFVNYYFAKNNQRAAQYFEKAYKLSGYKPYALLASRMLAEVGNLDLSWTLLNELARDNRTQTWSNSIQEMMKGVEQKKQLDFLYLKIEEYRQKYGRYPEKIEELIQAGLISPEQLPKDPFEGQYYIDNVSHKARSTKEFYLGVYKPKDFQE